MSVKHENGTVPADSSGQDENAVLREENRKLLRQLSSLESRLRRLEATRTSGDDAPHFMKAQRYLHLLLANSPDILLLFDKNGHFVYCTKIFLQRVGLADFEQINGVSFAEVFAKFADSQWVLEADRQFRRAMTENTPLVLDKTLDMECGEKPRSYSIHFTPLLDETGMPTGAMALFYDVTEIRRALERAEVSSRAKSHFLSNMSHEMRTPMNAILGMATIALSSHLPEQKNECLGKISNAASHLMSVINDVLDMAKMESGKFMLFESEFEFATMVSRVLKGIEFRAREKKQDLRVTLDDKIPKTLITDPQRLGQAVTHLLSNAVKFTADRGIITLSVTLVEKMWNQCVLRVEVGDTGIGISKDQQKRLFNLFEQLDDDFSRRFSGMGVGLTIVKRIVEKLEGNIEVLSEPGKGSHFIFTVKAGYVPEAVESPPASDGAGAETAPAAATPDAYSGRHILLAEDIEIHRELAAEEFKALGITPVFAEDGQAALAIFNADPAAYDMIFMDSQMPGLSGCEAAIRIRALDAPEAKVIPIIAMTAKPKEIQDCLSAGMNDHVSKPLDASEIMEKLRVYMPERPAPAPVSLPKPVAEARSAALSPPPPPAEAPASPVTPENPPQPATLPAAAGDYADRRILLVEDVEINREIALAILEPTGVAVDCAEDGRAALEMFSASPAVYDLILMDIHMPNMDGYEATLRIRALEAPEAGTVPIIAMTANSFKEDVEKCLAVGMNDHICKPINFDDVLQKLAEHMPRR